MSAESVSTYERVGPVLQAGPVGNAIVAAIRDLNEDVLVMDRGAYLRVLVPHRCVVTRSGIEKHLGRSFRFPGELETVMSAFKGTIRFTESDATWQLKEQSAMRDREGGQ
jgi:toluene monooxygenase system protein D